MAVSEGGGLSPAGRFDRIEASLVRIETKLDMKADVEDNHNLEKRISALESGDTPLARVLTTQFAQLQVNVQDIVLHGSENARSAGLRVAAAEERLTRLETLYANTEAVDRATHKRLDFRSKLFGLVFGSLGIFLTILNLVEVMTSH